MAGALRERIIISIPCRSISASRRSLVSRSRPRSSGQWSSGTKPAESISVSAMAKCSSRPIFPCMARAPFLFAVSVLAERLEPEGELAVNRSDCVPVNADVAADRIHIAPGALHGIGEIVPRGTRCSMTLFSCAISAATSRRDHDLHVDRCQLIESIEELPVGLPGLAKIDRRTDGRDVVQPIPAEIRAITSRLSARSVSCGTVSGALGARPPRTIIAV
jgi:hypothetical protein